MQQLHSSLRLRYQRNLQRPNLKVTIYLYVALSEEITKKYGVSKSTVGNIHSNRYWSHITVSNAKCLKKATTRNSGSKNNFSKLDESLVLRIKLALNYGVAVKLLSTWAKLNIK